MIASYCLISYFTGIFKNLFKSLIRFKTKIGQNYIIGKNRSASIDLYLCGHVHRGAFAGKNTGKLEWLDKGETLKEKKLPFDMIINEGPNIANENTAMLVEAKGDHLTVKLLKRDGSVYRSFKIK